MSGRKRKYEEEDSDEDYDGDVEDYDEEEDEDNDDEDDVEDEDEEEDEEEEEGDEIEEFFPKYIKKTEINKVIRQYEKEGYKLNKYIESKKDGEKGYLVTFSK